MSELDFENLSHEEAMESLDLSEEAAKLHIERGEALERLTKNKDWKLIIDDVYLKEEPARLVLLEGTEIMNNPDRANGINKDRQAIGSFFQFLRMISVNGQGARQAIEEYQQNRKDLMDQNDADDDEGGEGLDD